MIELTARGDVRVLHMDNGENRFNGESIAALHACIDEVEAVEGPVALVTVGEGKFFSNGLDLDWMNTPEADAGALVSEVHRLLERVLMLDMVTVAAVNGHAFAGGAMLASAHDYLVMRQDRGYWCLPEVDLGLPLTGVMYSVLSAHVPPATLHDASLTGRRYTAAEAVEAGIVVETAAEADVLDRAVERAAALAGKDRKVIAEHKRLLFGHLVRPR